MVRPGQELSVSGLEHIKNEFLEDPPNESQEGFRALVESLLDGVAVFSSIRDEDGQIVDFRYEYINEAGCRSNQRSREEQIGHTLLELLPEHAKTGLLCEYIRVVETGEPYLDESLHYEDVFGGGQRLARAFDVRVVKFGDGFAAQWRDVTERKRLEQSETEGRVLAEALEETARLLNSTLFLDDVLDRILRLIDRVVPYDAVHIMLIEGREVRIVRAHGKTERGVDEDAYPQSLNIDEIRNLRVMQETGQPVVISDTWSSSDWVMLPESRWIRSYAGAPLNVKGRTIGFLNANISTPKVYTEAHGKRLHAFANQAALAITNARLYDEIKRLAVTDELTGLYNRRGGFELGEREFKQSLRSRRPLSALLIDIDHFKTINDRHGHIAGDQILKTVAERFGSQLRDTDIAIRYGGEEFLVILPDANLLSASKIAERLCDLTTDLGIPSIRKQVHTTISVGVSERREGMKNLMDLVKQADRALYLAKQAGRNRIVAI